MKKSIIILAFALGLFACQSEEQETLDLRMQMEALQKEIESIARTECGQTGCFATVSCGCETMGFGKKPCGGPTQFIVYNKTMTNETLLQLKIAQFNELNELLNEQEGLISDCALVNPPVVDCVAGQCTSLAK